MTSRLRALYIANKRLPPTDYRVLYPAHSQRCQVTFGLPGRPENVAEQDYVYFGFGEGFRPAEFKHLFRLLRYLRQRRRDYDFVHFYATTLVLFGPLLAFLAGLPAIITLTGFGRTFSSQALRYKLLRPIYVFLLALAVGFSRGVLFQNQADLALLRQRLPRFRHKFFYAGSAVAFPVTENKRFDAPRLRVLLLARLLPDKGIEDFLSVAEQLQPHGGFDFVLAGPPSFGFEALFARVQDFAARGIIEYAGELDSAGAQQHYQQAHILFFPSHAEGMSRVMLEAGFAGLCPLAYDIPSNRDLLTAGRGFLIPKRDLQAAISVLTQLNRDRAQAACNAQAYQAYIVQHYNISAYAQRMDDILSQLGLAHV